MPATVLAQAIRRPERQVRLVRQPTTDVVALDRVAATNVGRLLAASGTSDIVDAHVVCARRVDQHVVTSDPDDLRRRGRLIPMPAMRAPSAVREPRRFEGQA